MNSEKKIKANPYYQSPKLTGIDFSYKCIHAVIEYSDEYDYQWDGIRAGIQIEYITGEGETLTKQLSDLEKNIITFLNKFCAYNLPLPTERRSIWPIVIDRRKYTLRVFQRRIQEILKKEYEIFLQQK